MLDKGKELLCACGVGLILAVTGTAAPPVRPMPSSPYHPVSQQQPPASAPRLPLAEPPRPPLLQRPLESPTPIPEPEPPPPEPLLRTPIDPPLGYAGPSGVLPRDSQENSHFVPIEDRWRIGFPEWDRYGNGHPRLDDYPFVENPTKWNPYMQNVLKGDYPIIGQNTFLNITATILSLPELHQVPTATTPFESTRRPFQEEFFGNPNQVFLQNFFMLSFDLFHGDAAFKPVDWRLKLMPVFNISDLNPNELAVVNPNVLDGIVRVRTFMTPQEWFVERKLADLSPDYDFVSVRAGSQPFTSDFRGFIFDDVNRAIRLFGTRLSNRDQFNLIYFNQQEKDTNSTLNTFSSRNQSILIGNYYRQDFIWPGYTAQVNVVYNHDDPDFKFDKNNFLVRPDATGVFQPHQLDVVYLGWTGEGHIDRYNIAHAFYWVLGHDSRNPLANRPVDVNAQMAAVELSYDRDWARFRTSVFWASGDGNISNSHATGFDAVFDNPAFAGGGFSYWQRQAIQLFNVNLTNRGSLLADLRSSKIQGQSNFVNPGVLLFNFGLDFDITPKLKMINNVNLLWFDKTNVLEQFTFDGHIDRHIGTDLSMGFEYRPLLNNNVIMVLGLQGLLPGDGFKDLYNNLVGQVNPLGAIFAEMVLTY